uniref:Uncharacterized protein n=1 Tax=Oryza sativa subsp. japonica TaxID=39947 RepID=Q69PV0_ORYSJ|nr:hypothetical protein [Oryza sativa Japonica Group]
MATSTVGAPPPSSLVPHTHDCKSSSDLPVFGRGRVRPDRSDLGRQRSPHEGDGILASVGMTLGAVAASSKDTAPHLPWNAPCYAALPTEAQHLNTTPPMIVLAWCCS